MVDHLFHNIVCRLIFFTSAGICVHAFYLLFDELSFFRFVASARQLAKALEVPLVNDLGYTKRYVRCLQVMSYILLGSLRLMNFLGGCLVLKVMSSMHFLQLVPWHDACMGSPNFGEENLLVWNIIVSSIWALPVHFFFLEESILIFFILICSFDIYICALLCCPFAHCNELVPSSHA